MPWRRSPLAHTVRALAHAVDAKGGYVPGHCEGVAYLIGMMATELGYSAEEVAQLELAAMLHDVGKLHVPDSILLAERRLTEEEFDQIKRHALMGAEIVRQLDGVEYAVDWILHHHERWDGNGYPHGLKGDEIPWASRMLAVADAFHVMTTDRPYQAARTRNAALEVLQTNAGTQFCPVAIELLMTREAAAVTIRNDGD